MLRGTAVGGVGVCVFPTLVGVQAQLVVDVARRGRFGGFKDEAVLFVAFLGAVWALAFLHKGKVSVGSGWTGLGTTHDMHPTWAPIQIHLMLVRRRRERWRYGEEGGRVGRDDGGEEEVK